MRLMVSGVGFEANAVLEPLRLLKADSLLLVWGANARSEVTKAKIVAALKGVNVRAVFSTDWDPVEFYAQLEAGVRAMGYRDSTSAEVFVNLTAGHGIMHACLGHMAYENGWRMVHWRPDNDEITMFSHYDIGVRRVPRQSRVVARAIAQDWRSAKDIIHETRLAQSTVYDSLRRLKSKGLVNAREVKGASEYRLQSGVKPDGST